MEILIKIDNQQVSVAQSSATPSSPKPEIATVDAGSISQDLQMATGMTITAASVNTTKKVAAENAGPPSAALLFSLNGGV